MKDEGDVPQMCRASDEGGVRRLGIVHVFEVEMYIPLRLLRCSQSPTGIYRALQASHGPSW